MRRRHLCVLWCLSKRGLYPDLRRLVYNQWRHADFKYQSARLRHERAGMLKRYQRSMRNRVLQTELMLRILSVVESWPSIGRLNKFPAIQAADSRIALRLLPVNMTRIRYGRWHCEWRWLRPI